MGGKLWSRRRIPPFHPLGEISPEEFRKAIRKEVSEALSDHEIDDMWNLMLLDIPREKLD